MAPGGASEPAMAAGGPGAAARSLVFAASTHSRHWWHWGEDRQYVPDVYAFLAPHEWAIMAEWFEESKRAGYTGEMAIPMVSLLRGFIVGSGLSSIVQLGHYAGYSTLILGFALRRMKRQNALFSIDRYPAAHAFCRAWVQRARLTGQVRLHLGDSADPVSAEAAAAYLGRAPQAVIIDSSHQYAHTVKELDFWFDRLEPGGMLFLHDTSEYAASFDKTGQGGVRRAVLEWRERHPGVGVMMIDGDANLSGKAGIAYADGCGLGMIQKPAPPPVPIPPRE
jgi:predicted O-methyltransferase YrrM